MASDSLDDHVPVAGIGCDHAAQLNCGESCSRILNRTDTRRRHRPGAGLITGQFQRHNDLAGQLRKTAASCWMAGIEVSDAASDALRFM